MLVAAVPTTGSLNSATRSAGSLSAAARSPGSLGSQSSQYELLTDESDEVLLTELDEELSE